MFEVLAATLIFALMLSIFDDTAAIIYALVASQVSSLANWATITLAFIVYYVAKQAAKAVKG